MRRLWYRLKRVFKRKPEYTGPTLTASELDQLIKRLYSKKQLNTVLEYKCMPIYQFAERAKKPRKPKKPKPKPGY